MNKRAFTILELCVASAAGFILLAVLTASAVSLQKSFQAAQSYLEAQSATSRLIDYLDTDLRNATAISVDGVPFRSGEVTLSKGAVLEIRCPLVYQSQDASSPLYSQTQPLVATSDTAGSLGVDYAGGLTTESIIRYSYGPNSSKNSTCYQREVDGKLDAIVERAENIDCDLVMHDNGRRVEIQTWFVSTFGDGTARVNSSGIAMIRNPRRDLTP